MGNFFVDLQRASFFVLLPLAIIIAAVIALNGVPMTLQGAAQVTTLEGVAQTIARGPAAGPRRGRRCATPRGRGGKAAAVAPAGVKNQ